MFVSSALISVVCCISLAANILSRISEVIRVYTAFSEVSIFSPCSFCKSDFGGTDPACCMVDCNSCVCLTANSLRAVWTAYVNELANASISWACKLCLAACTLSNSCTNRSMWGRITCSMADFRSSLFNAVICTFLTTCYCCCRCCYYDYYYDNDFRCIADVESDAGKFVKWDCMAALTASAAATPAALYSLSYQSCVDNTLSWLDMSCIVVAKSDEVWDGLALVILCVSAWLISSKSWCTCCSSCSRCTCCTSIRLDVSLRTSCIYRLSCYMRFVMCETCSRSCYVITRDEDEEEDAFTSWFAS